jgi:hypothetical protein
VRASLALGLVMAAGPASAFAQTRAAEPAPEPVRVLVQPPSDCLTDAGFFGRIRRRTSLVRLARPGEPARRFIVQIVPGPMTVGRLWMETPDQSWASREVEGSNCTEVADALALVASVAVDPHTLSPGQAEPGLPQPPTTGPPNPPAAVPTAPPSHPRQPGAWRHGLGVETSLLVGVAHVPALAGIGVRYSASHERQETLGALLGLGVVQTLKFDEEVDYYAALPNAKVRYDLLTVNLGLCPLGGRLGSRVRLYPCLGGELGRLQAQGVELPGSTSASGLFAAVGGQARVILRILGPLNLVGGVGPTFPLWRHRIEVMRADSGAAPKELWKTGQIGFLGSLGLALSPL